MPISGVVFTPKVIVFPVAALVPPISFPVSNNDAVIGSQIIYIPSATLEIVLLYILLFEFVPAVVEAEREPFV